MKSILVTGGAGFIGSNFVEYKINRNPDFRIINFDALTYAGTLDNLKQVEKRQVKRLQQSSARPPAK